MKIRRVSWTPYKIPFKSDFRTAHGAIPVREGAILRLETDDGRIGLGDIAPLESYNAAKLEDALTFLSAFASYLIGTDEQEDDLALAVDFDVTDTHDPKKAKAHMPVFYALAMAKADILAQEANQNLATFFAKQPIKTTQVAVNATIGAAKIEDAVREAHGVAAAGFRVAKLKVGVMDSDEAEIKRIIAVHAALGADPHIDLRLDANGAWTAKQAIKIINALETFECIHLVEQPTPSNDLDALAEVQRNVRIDIAADETARNASLIDEIIQRKITHAIVLKPAIVCWLTSIQFAIKEAQKAHIKIIVTSMLESGIGVAGALHLAATLKQPALACGLATTSLLEADLLKTPLEVRDGYMSVPQGAGLGVELDEDQLRRYGGKTVVVE